MLEKYWQAEWLLYEKVDFDGVNKIIKVYPWVTTLDIREDVWSAFVRWQSMADRNYSRYEIAMERTGLEAIPGGQTGDFYFLVNGWKLYLDFSRVAVSGVLYSRDYNTPYYTLAGRAQIAAEVSSVVNTVNIGGGESYTPEEYADAVWANLTRTLTQNTGLTIAQDSKLESIPTAQENAQALLQEPMPADPQAGSFAAYIKKKLLTVSKFIGLK